MIIVKQSHFHCSRHYIIAKSIHIIPNVFHQCTLFHYTCVCSSWESQPCFAAGANSQEQLQPGTPMAAGMLHGTHPFSKHNCINICLWRAQSCTASGYILILNSYCKFLCQLWHNQTRCRYSNFGNSSLVHSF